MTRASLLGAGAALLALLLSQPAVAQSSTGVSDTEIRIGQTMPYSGAASAYGTIGRAMAAFFAMVNDAGGINGRKIRLISLDDGYSPPKTVEQTRRLIEQDEVLLLFGSLGTAPNAAVQRYLNERKIPQLFLTTGATRWGDPQHFPWTMGWEPTYQTEGHVFARYILREKPRGKIAVLYQNDEYGKDYVKGLRDGLGAKAAEMIVAERAYDASEPTVDSQVIALSASGADVFYDVSTPKFAAQAIRRAYAIGWQPLHFLNSVSNSVGEVLEPAGIEASKGIVTIEYEKDPTDPQWHSDPGFQAWSAWMSRYYPDGNKKDTFNVTGYDEAATLVQVLRQCGDDLSRENVMRQAASLRGFVAPMLLPGITIDTSATDYYPIKRVQLARFDGQTWQLFGPILGNGE